jgi:hypothetical protein
LRGSNTTGIYAGYYGTDFYYFNYTYNGNSSTMSNDVFLTFDDFETLSPAFSADNSRLILTGY